MTDNELFWIYRITRSKSGLRVWIIGATAVGRRFRGTVFGGNLLLDEVDKGEPGVLVIAGNRTGNPVWNGATMGDPGPRLDMKGLKILPTLTDGKYAFVVPDIPGLADHRRGKPPRARRWRVKQAPVPPVEPVEVEVSYATPDPYPWPTHNGLHWTRERIKQVLEKVRDIETLTSYRLTRNGEGLAAFVAPPIDEV